MRTSLAILGLAGAVAAVPQAVTSAITPSTSPGPGCQSSVSGTFEIQVVNATGSASSSRKRDVVLVLSLNNGVLMDEDGRQGYIASNFQFQFDPPPGPQAGALYTAGWTVCPNGDLSLGSQTMFYQCLSGTFYNLYSKSTGAQCSPIYIQVINSGSTTGAVTQTSDGQPQETPVPICQYTDGQAQVTSCNPVSQYTDGQVQAPTGNPISQYTDGQVQAPTGTPVCQYTDGQPQESDCAPPTPTGTPVAETSDGQPQQLTTAPPTMMTTTGYPVSETSDGQPQAPTSMPYVAAAGKVQAGAVGLAGAFLAVLAL